MAKDAGQATLRESPYVHKAARISAENITMKTVSQEVGFTLRFDEEERERKAEIAL